jgi:hypothetical protein
MPADDGFGFHDKDGGEKVAKPARDGREHPSVEGPQTRTLDLPAQDDDLLAQQEVLRDEHRTGSHEGDYQVP